MAWADLLPTTVRAALPAVPVVSLLPGVRKSGGPLPERTLERHDVALDPGHVARYADLCGFPRKDVLPLPYPHLLAFGLHMEIMTAGDFPFPAIGTVHLENSITQHRPIALTEALQVTAYAENLRPHPKGQVFDMVTRVHSRAEPVWEETSTFLRRGAGQDDAPAGTAFPAAPATGTTWRLPGDLGRRYASVSGDHNPIHLYPLTAKALGFPRQIAHGMWSMARCVGALENRLPAEVTVAVAFKKPILLPGTIAFGSRRVDDRWAFSLSSPSTGAPHLAGSTSAR
ncbi:MaoC/PaaZ C-terminal domain-containing protein [Nocardioides sp.]|uniref:MaoC family dehydratase n=1 Tax=Nocardioides sp. TaxID=35761 RepID=UPI00260DB149|nr:MaoC/PaaZ C-terminal domain-containing protein [Nocardioides sp.]MDI6908541.1 MaoC/PaaZ C-terminal domain-containing protein [Nocardioides sp.]